MTPTLAFRSVSPFQAAHAAPLAQPTEQPAAPAAEVTLDEAHLPALLEQIMNLEGDHLDAVDVDSIDEALQHGEWGIAYSVLAAVSAQGMENFTEQGRQLMAAAIGLMNSR